MAQSNASRRWPLLLLTLVAAGGVIAAAIFGPGARKPGGLDPAAPATEVEPKAETTSQSASTATPATTTTPATAAPQAEAASATPIAGLHARLPKGTAAGTSRTSIGSLQPDKAGFLVDFSPGSAGIQRITFSDIWVAAAEREMARAHRAAVASGATNVPALPSDDTRYNLHTLGMLQGFEVPLLAARAIEIDGQLISLFGAVWTERGPGAFETEVADGEGNAIVRIQRVFAMEPAQGAVVYDMRLNQRVENVSGRPLKLRWIQYGPGDLSKDPGGMMDIRRFQFGYLYGAQRDPQRANVIVHGAMFDRDQVMKLVDASTPMLWPQEAQRQQGFELSWFGTTNRYFALAVHAADPTAPKGKVLSPVHEVWALSDTAAPADRVAFTELRSDAVMVAAGATAAFDMGVFAGPLDPRLLEHVEPYHALRMDGLILYLISGCCSFCTFSWLANLIVMLLTFLHDHVVFDWSLAIIVLVALVRLALHPVTRYSQVQMARVTKGMAAIKPELEALQKRYASDPKRMQQEQFRLYREHNINPAGCVGGMLPTFLQMPIWIALYAVLYFAFDLRQAPAFFGLFQQFGGWGFLADLSAPDKFVQFSQPLITWPFELSSINLIPLLMSVVFFFQQKYMAPPTTGTLTPEQQQQQKMMKWMTVILFPVMLYSAPSGLTLYIMTSTCVGILEGKRIRAQIDRMDFTARKGEPRKQDRLGKLYEAAMKRAQEKRSQGRRFKDRD